MRVTREGTKLTACLDSNSKWRFSFEYECGSECHADLVMSVINQRLEAEDLCAKNRERYHEDRERALQEALETARRSNAALRGHINRLKKQGRTVEILRVSRP